MSGRDPIVAILKELDRPAAPRGEFADALRARLLAELAGPDGAPVGRRAQGARMALRYRRRVLAGAVVLALVAAIVIVVLLSRPVPASAVDVILQAQRAFATTPPFEATLRVDLNPDGSNGNSFVPKGATETVVISYGGPVRFRAGIVAQQPRVGVRSVPGPGSYVVYDGRRHVLGHYDALRKRFYSSHAPSVRPLEFLSWHGAYPDWERICHSAGSKVLPNARIAGRQARHIRCDDYQGGSWQLWIDRRTGLLLKIVGQVGGDDYFPGLEVVTSAKGGFQVEHVRYKPAFRAGTFRVAAPAGAFDYQARLRTAIMRVPPFRAVIFGRTYTDELWWRNDHTWRRTVLRARPSDPNLPGGAGSFEVYAQGRLHRYNAHDNTYSIVRSAQASAIEGMLPEANPTYPASACPIVGHGQIAGQQAVHRRCSDHDVWVDSATGLALGEHSALLNLQIRSIHYRPTFPPGTFRFVPPVGSRITQQLANDPYYKTKLTPGKPAPNWQAQTLGGGAFRPSDLRGQPALLLLFSDTCGAGDPTCNVFPALEQTYKKWKDRVRIVWVDLQGTAKEAKAIQHHNRLTLPIVVDDWHRNAVIKAWNIQAYPYWLLLDAHGRVIEARFKPQATNQLDQLLAKAR